MRILHILDHSIPLQSGYSFRTLAILREQRALGWDTVQLTTPKHSRPYLPVEAVDGWTFHRTPPVRGLNRLPLIRELAQMWATERRLARVIAETRPDILHAHSPVLDAIPAIRVGRRAGLPVVYEVRAFWEDAAASHGTGRAWGLRYRFSRALESWALRRVDAVTCICEGLKGDIMARGLPVEKITVIPNAVDIEKFAGAAPPDRDLARSLGLADKTVLGFVGSFYSYEGLDLLLRALPAVLAGKPDVRLLLVGGGPEARRLRRLAETLNIRDKVAFTGRVPHDQVQRYYDLIDLLVYPRAPMRLTELVTPLKPLEAMAQGKIVVASRVGGHLELIRDGETGYLFDPGKAGDLAATLLRVIGRRTDWPRQRTLGRRFVEQERSWRGSVARYRAVYERLLTRNVHEAPHLSARPAASSIPRHTAVGQDAAE